MNDALQALEVKVENGGATPQGKVFAKEWNVLVEAVKALDLKEFDEAALLKFLQDNGYVTEDNIPTTDLSGVVTLTTEQAIPGRKNFVGGVEVNGQELVYDAEKKVWQLTGDLIVTGAVTMFGSLSGFTPSTVTDAVLVDNETIIKVKDAQGNWVLCAPGGGGSGGTGGGLTAAEVNALISNALSPVNENIATKWTQDDAKISNWDKAYEWGNHALAGYATTSAVSSAISSALTGYATQSWVEGKKYLTGITSSMVTTALGYTPYNAANFTKANIKSTLGISDWALAASLEWSAVNNRPTKLSQFTDDVVAGKYLSLSGGTVNGSITASSFIGNLTGNADRADYVAKTYIESINYTSESGLKLIRYDSNWSNNGFPANWTAGLSVMTDYVGWQMVVSGGSLENPYFRSFQDNGTWKAWRQLAFLTDNVASATKLQTARTIWGQSFDGTGNVDGNLTLGIDNSTTDQYLFRMYRKVGSTRNRLLMAILDSNDIEFSYYDHASAYKRLIFGTNDFQFFGGNVAIGGTTADELFHVHGTAKASLFKSVNGYTLTSSAATYCGLVPNSAITSSGNSLDFWLYNTANIKYLANNHLFVEGNVAVGGTTADEKLHVYGNAKINNILSAHKIHSDSSSVNSLIDYSANGTKVATSGYEAGYGAIIQSWISGKYLLLKDDGTAYISCNTTINGDLLATGAITMFSQLSMKNVIDDNGLSLAQLAQIKPTRFTWKDGRDNRIHVGCIADYIQPILPEVVYETVNNELTVDYGSAAFYIGTSLIKPVVELWEVKDKQQQEIESLKKRVGHLENENRQLRAS